MQIIRQIKYLGILVCLALLASCATSDNKQAQAGNDGASVDAFVTVEDGKFYIGDKPYYFVGANFWYGAYLGATEKGQARLIKELDQLKGLGVTNLRVLAGSEASQLLMSVSPAIIQKPGEYNESILVGLDFLLDEMAKRDMKAVLYFTNFWQWSGGMAQYVAWDRGEKPHDPDVQGDWNGFMQYSAQFYKSERAKQWFDNFVEFLVNRQNTVNGKWYKEDTAIMSWELANEPRPGSDSGGHLQYEAFKEWIIHAAKFIKELDPNHLVTTGSEGSMGASRNLAWFEESHATEYVDYLTFHLWPKNWSWYDVKAPEKTFSSAIANTKAYILQHIEVAKRLNKPIVLEEFGLERDGGSFSRDVQTTYRDEFLKVAFQLIEQQIKIGAPIVGSNVWAWGGLGVAQADDFIWRAGDPFTGDPPQEAQGLNSIFSTDKSTLDVLADHAANLSKLQ